MGVMVLQDRNTLKSKQALQRALQRPFYQLRVLSGSQLNSWHVSMWRALPHWTQHRSPLLWWRPEMFYQRCFAIEQYRTAYNYCTSHGWLTQRSTKPGTLNTVEMFAQAFNLNKNCTIQNLLELNNAVVGIRWKTQTPSPKPKLTYSS